MEGRGHRGVRQTGFRRGPPIGVPGSVHSTRCDVTEGSGLTRRNPGLSNQPTGEAGGGSTARVDRRQPRLPPRDREQITGDHGAISWIRLIAGNEGKE